MLTSLLTIVGVLAMMFWISPLLALVALITVPLSLLVAGDDHAALAATVHRAVAQHRRAQRPHRGDLHRATRSCKVFGRTEHDAAGPSTQQNEKLYRVVASAPSSSPG